MALRLPDQPTITKPALLERLLAGVRIFALPRYRVLEENDSTTTAVLSTVGGNRPRRVADDEFGRDINRHGGGLRMGKALQGNSCSLLPA